MRSMESRAHVPPNTYQHFTYDRSIRPRILRHPSRENQTATVGPVSVLGLSINHIMRLRMFPCVATQLLLLRMWVQGCKGEIQYLKSNICLTRQTSLARPNRDHPRHQVSQPLPG